MPTQISIIGDNFMLPEMFEAEIRKAIDGDIRLVTHTNNWPGEALVHGHTSPGIDGLKEYFGDEETVLGLVQGSEILVTHLAPVTAGIIRQCPDLRLIVVSRGGPVNVNLEVCKQNNIMVTNTPGRNASAVAEFTIGLILTETRKIRAGHEGLKRATWRDDLYRADTTGRELQELTVGVVGYGAIGRLVVQYLKPFAGTILVCDPFAELSPVDAADDVVKVGLEDLLANSDVVTLHTKVTPDTVNMINEQSLAGMKSDALLINTTRGSLCDEAALAKALSTGQLGGAALDTFQTEPLSKSSPLLDLPNVTLTPHIAGASVFTVQYAAEMAAREVSRYLSGTAPVHPCW